MISGVGPSRFWTAARHRRPSILLLAAVLGWILLRVVRSALDGGNGLVGDYFTNPTWTGPPAFSAVDVEPSASAMVRRWNGDPPEQFSVRWTGFLTVGRPGLYTFTTTSDDGSQLGVDNQLVVDNGGMHSAATRSGSIRLDRGSHVVVLRYVQFGAASVLDWSWSRDGGAGAPVPAWALSQRPTSYATAVNARIVDGALGGVRFVIVLATLWWLRASVKGREQLVIRWMGARRRDATASYRDPASLVFSVVALALILFLPWPDSGPEVFSQAVLSTIRGLDTSVVRVLGGLDAFQADLESPRAGEQEALPPRVQQMLTMLRGHSVERYEVSDSIASDSWGFQQIVASAWPRKLEKDAKARFVLNVEPAIPGCTLIDRQPEVSLVYCP